ncbi:bifunctional metallophosphatase/5'-nucleotidase [Nocardiopsis trehalosi]|jgi:5'-nucleotidase|uniref:bifunctional metallophosphatase/5'-nucleotidase n=1 Tax=Nocardiopsis trehalosi TaxID=109329 RepID=UPI00082F11C5|nr:5'-nucleotidase C-terminal domain-containing protein [Nocardiopsis trehalosi]
MLTRSPASRRAGGLLAAGVLAAALTVPAAPAAADPAADGRGRPPRTDFTLTILHNNDGESQLLGAPADADYGGADRFTTLVHDLRRAEASPRAAQGDEAHRRGVVTVSSGDNYLAGPQFAASLDKGAPFYDSLAAGEIGYDALAIGNHEFDFGPDVLADHIEGVPGDAPFLSANLDVSAEPALDALADADRIAASTVVRERGERIGLVGAVTPALASISSPRDVVVEQDVRAAVQAEVDRLTRRGVDKIVLVSHLQGLTEDRELIPLLRGVDVVVAGGGDELMADDDVPLVPGDTVTTDPTTGEPYRYPLWVPDADGVDVPVVTTAGDYKYVGRAVVNFDRHGRVVSVPDRSGLVRVSGVGADAVAPDPEVRRTVTEPVAAYVDAMAENVVAESEVALEGRRDPGVRTGETNLGNLLSDALLDAGRDNAEQYGVAPPQVALQNSGGIRNNALIPAGGVSELDTHAVAPFANFVAVVPEVPRAQVKELLENAVSAAPAADGRFAQVAGVSFTYDPARAAQVVADDGTVERPGERVRDAVLDDGTALVADGEVVEGAAISVATNDFSARGGDRYPFRGLPFASVGLTYQQAFLAYLTEDLGGRVTAADYPEGGSGRITRVG